jgi:translation initiation factor IF-2
MLGMLEPKIQEILVGEAEVREVFNIPRIGVVAGCYVKDGKVLRNSIAHLIRDKKEILSAKVVSLKRFKEDVKEVAAGYECGISLEDVSDIQKEDNIQFYKLEEEPSKNV